MKVGSELEKMFPVSSSSFPSSTKSSYRYGLPSMNRWLKKWDLPRSKKTQPTSLYSTKLPIYRVYSGWSSGPVDRGVTWRTCGQSVVTEMTLERSWHSQFLQIIDGWRCRGSLSVRREGTRCDRISERRGDPSRFRWADCRRSCIWGVNGWRGCSAGSWKVCPVEHLYTTICWIPNQHWTLWGMESWNYVSKMALSLNHILTVIALVIHVTAHPYWTLG